MAWIGGGIFCTKMMLTIFFEIWLEKLEDSLELKFFGDYAFNLANLAINHSIYSIIHCILFVFIQSEKPEV